MIIVGQCPTQTSHFHSYGHFTIVVSLVKLIKKNEFHLYIFTVILLITEADPGCDF